MKKKLSEEALETQRKMISLREKREKKLQLIDLNPSKTKQIIIAKYKEEMSWLKMIHNIPYIVYDKYNKKSPHHLPNIPLISAFPVEDFEGLPHIKTPTGRESHTYLYHIIKHYDELADINIFLQGDPIEVYSDTRETLRALLKRDFQDVNFLTLNFPLIICDKRASPLHRGLPLERVFKRLLQGPCPDLFAYSWGAMFCVSKEYIRKRPLAFYEEMMQIVYEEPLSGYIFERLWPTLIGCQGFLPHPSYPKRDRSLWDLPGLLTSSKDIHAPII